MPANVAIANGLHPVSPSPKNRPVELFSTCPSSMGAPANYTERITEVALWSEAAGCTGILVYTDNTLADPWLVSQILIQAGSSLCPLVAVQPVYMHPYSVAKMVSTLGFLHNRRLFLNMVAGGFKNDLAALDDPTPHDSRYDRLREYTLVIQGLLRGGALTFEGQLYRVKGLTLNPALAPELMPGILMSGSSPAGMTAALSTGAVAIKYPEPPSSAEASSASSGDCGVRIGIIARPQEEQAWSIAFQRFPEDRKGQLTRQIASKVSDSHWHKSLSQLSGSGTYWLVPFENYQTNCPYLVGSYENVAEVLAKYLASGFRTFILDIPAEEEEFAHTSAAFQAAFRWAAL